MSGRMYQEVFVTDQITSTFGPERMFLDRLITPYL
jgi:hypothetical protein